MIKTLNIIALIGSIAGLAATILEVKGKWSTGPTLTVDVPDLLKRREGRHERMFI